jgi:dihydroflavonol-4-reductase
MCLLVRSLHLLIVSKYLLETSSAKSEGALEIKRDKTLNGMKSKETVLVTGGTGYLAKWVIAGLVREGFGVRATLRNLHQEAEVRSAIAEQVDSAGHLSFASADLLKDEGWMTAMAGCQYVLHVASPMGQGAPKGTDLIGPARDGTLRVLKAAAASGIERVVCTSSAFASQPPIVPGEMQPLADENTWTNAEEKGLPEYARSKILAERAAWEFMKTNTSSMTLATVLPGLILGPVMKKSVSGSLELVSRLLTGKLPALPRIGFGIIETQNLVDLHLRAMTSPAAANQRFIGVGDFLWISEIAEILRKQFPDRSAKIPSRQLPDWILRLSALFQDEARFMAPMLGKRREIDSSKTSSLLQWRAKSSSEAVIQCAKSLIEHGLA